VHRTRECLEACGLIKSRATNAELPVGDRSFKRARFELKTALLYFRMDGKVAAAAVDDENLFPTTTSTSSSSSASTTVATSVQATAAAKIQATTAPSIDSIIRDDGLSILQAKEIAQVQQSIPGCKGDMACVADLQSVIQNIMKEAKKGKDPLVQFLAKEKERRKKKKKQERKETGGGRPGQSGNGKKNPGKNPGKKNPGKKNPGKKNPGKKNPGKKNPGKKNPGKINGKNGNGKTGGFGGFSKTGNGFSKSGSGSKGNQDLLGNGPGAVMDANFGNENSCTGLSCTKSATVELKKGVSTSFKKGGLEAEASAAAVVRATGQVHASADLKNGKLSASAKGQVFAGVEASAAASFTSKHVNAQASVSAQAGAGASGSAEAEMDLKKGVIRAGVEADAFAGTRANAAASLSIAGGLIETDVKASSEMGASAQGKAGMEMDLKKGTFNAEVKASAFAGIRKEASGSFRVGGVGVKVRDSLKDLFVTLASGTCRGRSWCWSQNSCQCRMQEGKVQI
jgi:hypothetical protein